MWHAEVRISPQMYEHSQPFIRYLHFFPLFPFSIKRTRSGLYLKWSPGWTTYWFTFGLILVAVTSYTIIRDMATQATSVYQTDRIAGLFGAISTTLLLVSAIFVTPSYYSQLFDYIRCANKIDDIIGTFYTKEDRFKSLVLLNMLLTYDVFGILVDCYFFYEFVQVAKKTSIFTIVLLEMLILYVNGLTFTLEYAYRHMVHSLDKRIERLNALLESECLHIKRGVKTNRWTLEDTILECSVDFVKLRKTFLILMDSADALNQLFASNVLMLFLSIFSFLSMYCYLFILTLESKRKGSAEMLDLIVCLSILVIEALVLTEPCYACLQRMEGTKKFVCKLLSLKLDRYYRKQVDAFVVVLCLKQLKFSVYGLFEVDRFLFTSLIGAVTTYVVIFLQYQESETQ